MLINLKNILSCVICGLLLSACVSTDISGINYHEKVANRYDTYTVRTNDDMLKIANKFAIHVKTLAKFNNIPVNTELHIGQVLKIPVPQLNNDNSYALLAKNSLHWPMKGKVVKVFSKNKNGNRGINIAGWLGQEIFASADGKVVFSGATLSGFGNMLIIKHSEEVVTVYAFVQNVLVKEGQMVKAGTKIAYVGNNSAGDVLLHFEVRIKGIPQNPFLYLQKI